MWGDLKKVWEVEKKMEISKEDQAAFDAFDESFKAAPADSSVAVPDGRYTVEIQDMKIGTTKTTKNPKVEWHLRVLAGPYAGKVVTKRNIVTSADNVRFLKSDLHRAGCGIESMKEVGKVEQLVGAVIEVEVKYANGFTNVWIQRRLSDAEAAAALAAGEDTTAEDPLPF